MNERLRKLLDCNVCKARRKPLIMAAMVVILACALTAILVHAVSGRQHPDSVHPEPKFAWQTMRLPDTIRPSHYDLDINIDLQRDVFRGRVSINVTAVDHTDLVILHKLDLDISGVEVVDDTQETVPIKRLFEYKKNEYFIIETGKKLEKYRKYVINMQYNGTTRSDLSGLYKSSFVEKNVTHKVASTFFSPISARKAFPCFDEPKFKAVFVLSISHSSVYHALSNMPVHKTEPSSNGNIKTYFEPTLKMSTYIVCWVVSEYHSINLTTSSGLQIRSWAPQEQLNDTEYAMNVHAKLLKYYEQYFNISYPLKKLDIVVVPNFGPGAMENWGIITYRSSRLLISKTKSTEQERQATFSIIAHEVTHQWFGNLATMKFWTDAWLKEGFANYIGYYGNKKIEPKMEPMKKILSKLMVPALKLDAYFTSHPISTQARSPDEIREIFDTITYNKGSCVVQMLQTYLGEEEFRRGLQNYLRTYSYKNADQDDLWQQLSIASGVNVKSVMDTWTLQMGYPVISITRIDNATVKVHQQRFSLDTTQRISESPSPFKYLWKVPLTYTKANGGTYKYLLTARNAVVQLPVTAVLNPNHRMYYVTHYDPQTLQHIRNRLFTNHTELSVQDRTGIIFDLFSTAAMGLTKLDRVLDLIQYVKNENDYYPWEIVVEEIGFILKIISKQDAKQKLQQQLGNLTLHMVNKLGWGEMSTVNNGLLQVLMVDAACSAGVAEVVQQTKAYFREWMKGNESFVHTDLCPSVRSCVIANSGEEYWNFTYAQYLKSGSEKWSLLMNLANTKDEALLKRLLNYTLDTSIVESQDGPYLLGNIAKSSPLGRQLVWNFIVKNIDTLIQRYGNELFLLGRMMADALSDFHTEHMLNEVSVFFARHENLGSATASMKQSLEKIRSNIQWKQRNEADLVRWLSKRRL